jgi:preprotein translocase subunit SecY
MKTLETVVRRLFFYGSFVVAALAVLEKIMNLFKRSLMGPNFSPERFLEAAAIGLLFAIVMQLHSIRLLLGSKSAAPPK